MSLPGGLVRPDGVVDRTYTWKPLNGFAEADLAAAARVRNRVEAVSRILEAALERLAGEPVSRARVDSLCVPDRRYLMIELGRTLGLSAGWSSHACEACGELFDFPLDLADLPVEPSGEPGAVATVAGRARRLRFPTGADQMCIGALDDDEEAVRLLAASCVVTEDDEDVSALAARLSADDLIAIETALEEAAPRIPWAIGAHCPSCKVAHAIAIDVSAWRSRLAEGPMIDVHEIARAYGWSERDILALPRRRRLEYLEFIRGGTIAGESAEFA